jgi:TolA-binding protein
MNVMMHVMGKQRVLRWMAVGGCLCSLLGAVRADESLDNQERLEFANGLYSRGMYEMAASEYRSWLRDFSKLKGQDVVNFRLADCYRRQGEKDLAVKTFRKVFDDYPTSEYRARAGYRVGELLLAGGKQEAAVAQLEAVLKTTPRPELAAAVYYALGTAQAERGKRDEAIAAFERIRKQYSNSSFQSYALLHLGGLYAETPETMGRSVEMYELARSRATSPSVAAEALFLLGELYARRGDFKKAYRAFSTVVEKYGREARVHEARRRAGWAAHDAGLYKTALALTAATRKVVPKLEKPEAWLYLEANCHRRLEDYQPALAAYNKVIKAYPKSGFARAAVYEKALVYFRLGRFGDAVKTAGTVDATPELRQDLYWLMAESYTGLDEIHNAIRMYRRIIKECPKEKLVPEARYRIGGLLHGLKQYAEASLVYRGLVTAHARHELAPRARYASGVSQRLAGKDAEAVADWQALEQDYAKHELVEDARFQRALAEIRMEKTPAAEQTLQAFMKRYRRSRYLSEVHYWIGVLQARKGKPTEAVAAYREALKQKPVEALRHDIEFQLALALQKLKEDAEAAKLLAGLLETRQRKKFTPPLLEWLADYWLRNGQSDEAIRIATRLVKTADDAAWKQIGLGLLGRARLAKKQFGEAEAVFKQVLAEKATTPFAAEAALRLGELVAGRGEHEEAVAYFDRAVAKSSDDAMLGIRARAYLGLARSSRATQDHDRARRYYLSIAILFKDPEIVAASLYEVAELLDEMGDARQARDRRAELLRRYPQSSFAKKIKNRKGS